MEKFVQKLQDALRRTVEAVKQKLDQGQEMGNDLIIRTHKLAEKLQQLGADVGEKLRQDVRTYQGKAKEFVQTLIAFFRRRQPNANPLSRSRRSLSDRLPELDEDETVRKICDTVVRLALPSHRAEVRQRCEKHARAVIRRLNERLHPESHQPDSQPDPEVEAELDRAEQPDADLLLV